MYTRKSNKELTTLHAAQQRVKNAHQVWWTRHCRNIDESIDKRLSVLHEKHRNKLTAKKRKRA